MSGNSKETPLEVKMSLKSGEHIDGGWQNGITWMPTSSLLKPMDSCLHDQRAFASRGGSVCWDPTLEEAEAEEGELKSVATQTPSEKHNEMKSFVHVTEGMGA